MPPKDKPQVEKVEDRRKAQRRRDMIRTMTDDIGRGTARGKGRRKDDA